MQLEGDSHPSPESLEGGRAAGKSGRHPQRHGPGRGEYVDLNPSDSPAGRPAEKRRTPS
jgi:hypothetical protein